MKKILFVSPSINPFNKVSFGAIQRSSLLLDACTKCGHVDVVTFVKDVDCKIDGCTVIYAKELSSSVTKSRIESTLALLNPWNVYNVFSKNSEAASILARIVNSGNYDFIVVRYVSEAMMCGLLSFSDRLVIDVDDNPLEVARNNAKTSKRFRKRLYHRLQAAEMKIALRKITDKILFAFYSNPKQANHSRSGHLPNIPYYDGEIVKFSDFLNTTPRILFFGNLNFRPNAIGIDRFVQKVLPLIKTRIPEVQLHIGGSCNDETLKVKWSSVDGVRVLGFVPDVRTEYEQCRVVVVPINSGAGTNIKVIEAMQMLRPLVSTSCGMRGFYADFKDGLDCFVADEDNLFADYVVRLLLDENFNHSMARSARKVIDEKYTRMVFNTIVAEVIR